MGANMVVVATESATVTLIGRVETAQNPTVKMAASSANVSKAVFVNVSQAIVDLTAHYPATCTTMGKFTNGTLAILLFLSQNHKTVIYFNKVDTSSGPPGPWAKFCLIQVRIPVSEVKIFF